MTGYQLCGFIEYKIDLTHIRKAGTAAASLSTAEPFSNMTQQDSRDFILLTADLSTLSTKAASTGFRESSHKQIHRGA